MIPKSAIGEVEVIQSQPSLTYGIDFSRGEIGGQVDGLIALEQAIYLILSTERFQYAIHSWNYGVSLNDMIGSASEVVYLDIEQEIKEALMTDDRIQDVTAFKFSRLKENVSVTFTVKTIYGDIQAEREVNL